MTSPDDQFSQAVLDRLATFANPIIARKLAEKGVSNLRDLPKLEAGKIFRDATLEACTLHFPDADVKMMRRLMDAIADERFQSAWHRLNNLKALSFDAFEHVRGIDGAVLLAGLAFPVRPLDSNTLRPVGGWARDAASAATVFQKAEGNFVGYDVCAAPFYLLVTDCISTLAHSLSSDPRLLPVRALMERGGGKLPRPNAAPFTHGCILLPRLAGERPETIAVMDPSPTGGSIMFFAGWKANGVRGGAPRDGIMPVPMRLLNSLLSDPMTLFWTTRSPGQTEPSIH